MASPKKQKTINIFLSLILVILLYAIWTITSSGLPANSNKKLVSDFPIVSCDFINTDCITSSADRTVHLEIISKDVSAFTPLTMRLTTTGFSPDQASIDFQGIEMFMGTNKLTLEHTNNTFTGIITLPGHTGHGMTWRALTTLSFNGKQENVIFEFPLM